MGSSLEAFATARSGALDSIAERIQSRVVRLTQGIELVPVPEAATPEDWQDAYEEFSYLAPDLSAAARLASTAGPIAYLEGETFAGEGIQRAVLWRRGQLAWGPRHTCDVEADAGGELVWAPDHRDAAINAALRELGVERGDAFDEYAALGLHLKRTTEDWLD